jgi:photosystem II stability/assembly factor-like uncharacterized protein
MIVTMRYWKLILSFFLLLNIASLLSAQTFLESQVSNGPVSFADFQKRLDQWSRQTNLKTVKGWKWLKRWEDFNAHRMNPDGSLPDPAIYLQAAQEVAAQKTATSKTATSGNWFPLGPDNYATPANPFWEPGIGRINCIAFHPTDPLIFWVGVAQGGVWKTVNGGQSWAPLTDNLPMLRISDIAVNPVNPEEIYLSVGDMAYFGAGLSLDNRKRHTHYGLGVYKTTDGGTTWNPTGLTILQTEYDFSLTRRVLIHPSNTLNLVAAGTYGIQRSLDAGITWTSVHDSIIWDLERDPVDPQVLYASTGYRSSLNMGSVSIMKSTDFGATWTVLPTGIPGRGLVQRVELAVSPSDHNYVYALCAGMDAGFGGLYRSTDAGASWNLQSATPNILTWDDGFGTGGQGWYDLALLVNPSDRNTIYTGGINAWGSTDGGATWDGVSYWVNTYGNSLHADQHQFAYNPVGGKYYICNDGGLYSSDNIIIGSWFDANNTTGYQWPTTWTKLSAGMQTTSFYRCSTTPAAPNNLLAGAQDNSTYFYDGSTWTNVVGGDGMECILHPLDPLTFYASSQYGNINGSNDGGLSTFGVSWAIPEIGEWTTPYALDPTDPSTLYAAYGNVWKTTNAGGSWNGISNFPIVPGYGQPNISSALAIAKSNPNYIYVAKRFYFAYGEPSALWVTTDAGASWTDRSAGLPDSLYFTYIAVDADAPATAYVTAGGFIPGVKVFKTTDAGATWTNVSMNLPNLPVNCILHDQLHAHNPIYVGMDVGVYYTNDTLNAWQLYAQDLPNVIVSELELNVTKRQIVAATFGRGLWGVDLKDEVSTDLDPGSPNHLGIQVVPNPNNGIFSVQFTGKSSSNLQIELIDIMGRKVYQEVIPPFQSAFSKDFMTPLAPGNYFLRATNDLGRWALRFVVD